MNSLKEKLKIAKVLASMFIHSSTSEEEAYYHQWLKEHPEHRQTTKRILRSQTYKENSERIKEFSASVPQAWKRIHPLLKEEKKPFFTFSWKSTPKYAALLLLLLLPASYLIYNWMTEESISEIIPGTLGGKVTLSNGNSILLPEGQLPEGITEIFVIDTNGINYQTTENTPILPNKNNLQPKKPLLIEEIQNTLRTLHGMEYHITLSDGTKVHLNAESKLTYPVCFCKEERIVQLEGEAYFDVASDSQHPFIVQTPHTAIKVTGTTFNVRAYPDEDMEYTTLITGKVEIAANNETFDLTPDQHFVYDKQTKSNTISTVNAEQYTSWKSGSFIFKNIPLENVMSYLSKWYGFDYTFEDNVVKQVQIGAYLNRYANMNPIINMIKELNLVDIKQREGILHISYKSY